MHVTMTEQ